MEILKADLGSFLSVSVSLEQLGRLSLVFLLGGGSGGVVGIHCYNLVNVELLTFLSDFAVVSRGKRKSYSFLCSIWLEQSTYCLKDFGLTGMICWAFLFFFQFVGTHWLYF